MKRVLLTGLSGTGKSTVVVELVARGRRAVDLDDGEWSEWVDVEGDPTGAAAGKDWRWREERVEELLSAEDTDVLFVSGCAENMVRFYPQFDHVVLLSAPAALIAKRLASRTTNPYGKRPQELAQVLENQRTIEPLLRRAADHEIDTSAPLPDVVSEILRLVEGAAEPNEGSNERVV